MSLSLQILKTFPPNTSLTLQLIGGEVDTVSGTDTKSTELALYGADPVISFKGLLGVSEDWRKRADEISKCDTVVRTTSSVLSHTLQKAFILQTVGLNVVENLSRCGRWQKFLISIVVSSAANRTTSTSRHPEEKTETMRMDSPKRVQQRMAKPYQNIMVEVNMWMKTISMR